MGDIAIRMKKTVSWDPVKGRVDDKAGDALYRREYRKPYTV
jgi:hypothetical protein